MKTNRRPPASGEPSTEARDLVEEILLMTDERDDSVPLTDWLPDEWVDRATALINEPRTAARATPPSLDVERLQLALERAALRHSNPENRAPGWGVIAHEVAAEYTRLISKEEQTR